MRRLSIARSVQLALLGLTIALTAIAGFGVAALYSSREDYEHKVVDALQVKAAAGKLLAASVVEEATLRAARAGTRATASAASVQARDAYGSALADTRQRAANDSISLRLVQRAGLAQAKLRLPKAPTNAALDARAPITALAGRQDARVASADAGARNDSRKALASITAAGGLALAASIALVALLLAGVRKPLEGLVDASARLAGGELGVRVNEAKGPEELRQLGRSFNAMAGDLEQANERLDAERRRLAVTVRSLGDGLVLVDEDGLVASANPRALQLAPRLRLGQPPAVGGLPLPRTEEALGAEVLIEHEDRTLAVTAARMEERDKDGGAVWTLRDATERARLERLKSEFVATASHELRSPLTSIKGFVELLRASDGLDERQREFLDIVLVSTNRLVDLVNDLLDIARLEAGRVEMHRRPVDVSEALEDVASLISARVAGKHQHLEVHVEAGTPPVLADQARLRQMLTNLVTNAHLYTQEHGTLTLRGAPSPAGVRIEISDTGRGMTSAELEHVFERFSRGAGSTGTPGTGLGLSIVKSLVELHGGTIDVASTPGAGTTFAITLPAVPIPQLVGRPREALPGKRVLVVDDEPDTARLIAERLEPYGVTCVLVHDGQSALARLREEHFDAMTLDVLMPGVSGFEVLRELREDPRLADLPVVVVSVFSGREALSGEWVVSKPIDTDELVHALGSAVLAGRVRVLAVGRPGVRSHLRDTLTELAIEHEWASTPLEAARLCALRRFEIALVDAGLPDIEAAIAGLDLRGRRLRRSVVVVSADGDTQPGLALLDAQPIPVAEAGAVVLALLEPAAGSGL